MKLKFGFDEEFPHSDRLSVESGEPSAIGLNNSGNSGNQFYSQENCDSGNPCTGSSCDDSCKGGKAGSTVKASKIGTKGDNPAKLVLPHMLARASGSAPTTTFTPAGSFFQAARIESVKELQKLVGLENVKDLIEEIVAYVTIERRREQEGLATEPMVLHMIFKGNPGTGKTTVARLMGRVLKELGVLQKGHLIEVERADLVGEYVGHTAHRTREQLRKGIGGVLFIDEAYSLARGGSRDFGREAIDTLVKSMEEHRQEMVIILAGYTDEMNHFLASNPGLRSRFPIHLSFADYSEQELFDIAELMIEERQYRLSEAAENKLAYIIRNSTQTGHPFGGNARFVRNLAEKAIRMQARRLVNYKSLSREQLIVLEACDIPEETDKIEGAEKVSSLELLNRIRAESNFAASEG